MPITGYQDIKSDITEHRKLFMLDGDDDLGVNMLEAATDSHQRAIDTQTSPDGEPWPPLSERYEKWKSRRMPGAPMAFLFGIMASPNEVFGERHVEERQAFYTYGQSDEAKEEACWFEEGDPQGNRPARRFTGLDEYGVQIVDDLVIKHLDSHLKA